MDELVHAEFRGGRTETAPMTWSQQVMWRAARLSRNQHLFLNLRRVLTVPRRAPADVPSVTQAIAALVSRHGALRTRVREVAGQLRQETAAAGELPIVLAHADADDSGDDDGGAGAAELARRLGDVAFDHGREWPVRFGTVVVDGRVRRVVLVFSHSTVDAYAADVVLRDLRVALLRGGLSGPTVLQSVDVARRQHGPDRPRSERAISYWTNRYRQLPATELAPLGPGDEPRLRRGVLISSAVATAARTIATRHRVSVSTVLLAATTAVAAGAAGRDICGLFTMSHNRFRPEYANAIANLGQVGFCVVDISDRPSFSALLPRVYRAALDGYSHAYYDTAEMRRRFTELGYDYATAFLPYYYFNDVRLPVGNALDDVAEAGPRQLRAAAERSSFSWTDGLDRASWHLLTHVVDEPGAFGLTLSADSRYRSPDSVEPHLRSLEALLVEATQRDVPWPWTPQLVGASGGA
ncbi:condensation domain-containing protein [Solwaraspora sp. WMMB335]|uniref:condensation domain-containing protein n=1 Tax=Solwaraspora sp. WMMB335 TaxID=3404118 RepID=UPI003B94F700